MALVGTALSEEAARVAAGEVAGLASRRRRRSPGEQVPQPTDHVVRLILDEGSWQQLANGAAPCGITVARYAGEVIEARAHELRWRGGH
jgi:hypothetical protein